MLRNSLPAKTEILHHKSWERELRNSQLALVRCVPFLAQVLRSLQELVRCTLVLALEVRREQVLVQS